MMRGVVVDASAKFELSRRMISIENRLEILGWRLETGGWGLETGDRRL
jgi:hypothetical protein